MSVTVDFLSQELNGAECAISELKDMLKFVLNDKNTELDYETRLLINATLERC